MFMAGWVMGFFCGIFFVALWINIKLDRRE